MTVMILERVSPSLRGEITRWMLEPKAGVFVGSLSAMVRERLWQKACKGAKDGACTILWSTNNEQGFQIDFWGDASRHITTWDGLQLVSKPNRQ